MEYTLAEQGAKVEIGSGVARAAKVLKDWQ
jgi:hypothetical protein